MILNSDICIYDSESIIERNVTYETNMYFPDWIMIGDDGGGKWFYIDKTLRRSPVYVLGSGCPFKEDADEVASSIEEWIINGVAYKEQENDSQIGNVDIYLYREPANGLKGMLQIKTMLTWGIAHPNF